MSFNRFSSRNDTVALEMSLADGDGLGIALDAVSLGLPTLSGGFGRAKKIKKSEQKGKLLPANLQLFAEGTGKLLKNLDRSDLITKSQKHIFSEKHIKGGIMELGDSMDDIMNSGIDIIEKLDMEGMLKKGPTQIKTTVNGLDAEIRVFIKDGKVMNFDMFKGHSPRNMGNTIT